MSSLPPNGDQARLRAASERAATINGGLIEAILLLQEVEITLLQLENAPPGARINGRVISHNAMRVGVLTQRVLTLVPQHFRELCLCPQCRHLGRQPPLDNEADEFELVATPTLSSGDEGNSDDEGDAALGGEN